ncbi:cold shock domain-containing protein [Flavitalea sp. BT771]|uniref:cold-shock protein n=1 Tax=Flavitalea sp. BT771 TaxID=3063329 RepID=UPI0026E453EF|nr:cold shock domain-containing protein [Flavitalea sp. BT771]MDO6430031.1 cold shock domain-containing protein [Flavitalea sp. BT771]MDV6219830.1 cold shock domain-containing protein [Flavitalea sp. BT771]
MSETWNKRERERNKQQKKKEKLERRQEKRLANKGKHDLESMLAYVDENGNLTSKPVDPKKRASINAEDIDISIGGQRDLHPADAGQVGVVTLFKTDKGYGFIKNLETQESYFFHVNSLAEPVKENNKVSFEVEKGPKGLSAINVRIVRG